MNTLRYIFDMKRSARMNMAIDEILFDCLLDEPVLRIYFWDKEYATIGYFQKNEYDAVRRITGGLMVKHKNDLSYGFCAPASRWPYLYSQKDTYKNIHTAVKEALSLINIESVFAPESAFNEEETLCVRRIYGYDLIFEGKKIAGSCMRRRGEKILVQGSVHINLNGAQKEKFSFYFARKMAGLMKCAAVRKPLSETELEKAFVTAREKYSNRQWNKKF